jgi:Tfp pilus assembly protein PilV
MMDRVLHRLRSETGTSLVEVIAAAVILIVVAGAVTSLITAAQRDSGQSRITAIAGDLAQSELEQLRAMRFGDLVGLSALPRTVPAGGLDFTVTRSSGWASEATPGSAVGCSSTANKPEALRVSVSVDWASNPRKPVRVDTLVAAPVSEETTGNFVVQINDRDGEGVGGVTVTMSGPGSSSGTTDSTGCVRFSGLEQGTYTVAFSQAGYVDVNHKTPISATVSVRGGETSSKSFDYDRGGGVNLRFIRHTAAATTAVTTVPGVRFQGVDNTVVGVLASGNTVATHPYPMWPQVGQYSVFADTCIDATKSTAVTGVAVNPGVTAPAQTDVKLPLVNVTVTGLPAMANGTTVKVRVPTPCNTLLPEGSGTVSGGGFNTQVPVPPGTLPYVCIYGQFGDWYWKRYTNVTVAPTDTWPGKAVNVDANGGLSQSSSAGAVCNS